MGAPSHTPAQLDIDRLGVVQAILADYAAKVAPWKAEADALQAKLLIRFAPDSPEALAEHEGATYRLIVGACSEQQAIDDAGKAKVYKWIGKEAFLNAAKITFESLKSALTPAQYNSVVSKERTGRRTVKVVSMAAPQRAA
jgi:hypothetical protein